MSDNHSGSIAALFIVFVLALGASPRQAEAGACTKLGFSNQCVVRADIRKNAVNSSRVLNNSLKAKDLLDEAGVDFIHGTGDVPLVSINQVIQTITLSAPTAGTAIVIASGNFFFDNSSGLASCSIADDSSVTNGDEIAASKTTMVTEIIPFAGTKGFSVAAGDNNFHLVCDSFAATVDVSEPKLVAMFFPTEY